MKRRKRVKTRTVLDRLESEGVIVPQHAKRLRTCAMDESRAGAMTRKRAAGENTPDYTMDYLALISALLQPDRQDARRARKRNFLIALKYGYFKAIGEKSATKRTAESLGVSVRTVSSAVRKADVMPEITIPTLVQMLREPNAWRGVTPAKSIVAIKATMRSKPQTIRSGDLRKGIDSLFKRIPPARSGRQ
jgi:hypothetical protein